jgi:hypothetical protein
MGGLGLYDRQRIRSGRATIRQMWDFRLREVVAADWDAAKDEQYARVMPQLALT